jgi:hypothetical protein
MVIKRTCRYLICFPVSWPNLLRFMNARIIIIWFMGW